MDLNVGRFLLGTMKSMYCRMTPRRVLKANCTLADISLSFSGALPEPPLVTKSSIALIWVSVKCRFFGCLGPGAYATLPCCTWAVRLLFWAAAFFCLVCLFAEAVAKLFALYASARHSNGVPCGASASFCLSYPGLALPLTVTHCRLRAHEHWLHPINSTFKYMYLIVLNLWTSTAALIVHRY